MPWVAKTRAPHPCRTPLPKQIKRLGVGAGSRWGCPRCGDTWSLWLDEDWPQIGSVALWKRESF